MRIKTIALALAAAVTLVPSCGHKKVYEYPFQDPSLKVEERVENLLSLLTPEEKVGLIMNKSVSVDRLGIPSYNWWSEACHGVRADGYTVYLQYIGMAATFNPDLIYDVFTSVSDEARANWNRSERDLWETYLPAFKALVTEANVQEVMCAYHRYEGILPLSKDVKKIAVLGPNADNLEMLNGNYGGTPTEEHARTLLSGIEKMVPGAEVVYDKACEFVDEYNTEDLVGKFNDGCGMKVQFYEGKSLSGTAMGLEEVKDCYDALIQAWYPGQGGADALGQIIFGDFNPSGRLPVTFYASTSQLPDFQDYRMEGHTYRYFEGEPMYPFGYGLSYSEFKYGEGKLSASSANEDKGVTITVPVKNVSTVDGDETVQVYVKSLDIPDAPIKSLKAFKKVKIAAGKTVNVKLSLDADSFSYYDGEDGLAPHSGKYQILYGSSSADSDLKALDFTLL